MNPWLTVLLIWLGLCVALVVLGGLRATSRPPRRAEREWDRAVRTLRTAPADFEVRSADDPTGWTAIGRHREIEDEGGEKP